MSQLFRLYSNSKLFLLILCVFIVVRVLFPDVPRHFNNFFYVFALLPALIIGVRKGFEDDNAKPFYGFLLTLIACTGISLFIDGELSAGDFVRWFKHSLYIVAFTLLLRQVKDQQSVLALCVWITALVGSVYSGYITETQSTFTPFEHRIVSAVGVGSAPMLADLIACFGFYLFVTQLALARYFAALMIVVLSIIPILFLQGRAAMLGLLFAGLAWLVLDSITKRVKWAVVVAVVGLALLLLLVIFVVYDFALIAEMLERGVNGGRFEMWQNLFARLDDCGYVFGCGYDVSPEMTVNFNGQATFFNFYHNLFLSTLYYAGLFALAVLVLFIVKGFCLSHQRQNRWLYSLIIACVCLNFEGDKLFNNPDSLWLLFWVPLALCFFSTEKQH